MSKIKDYLAKKNINLKTNNYTHHRYLGSSFSLFLKEIENYPLLSEEEELNLLKKVESGDKEAKNKLVLHNIRLVINIAKKYLNKGMALEDLVEEGILGLMKAIEKFDYRKGYKLSTYATWWIKQKISRAIIDKGRTIRLPVHVSEILSKIKKITYYFQMKYQRPPTIEELTQDLQLSAKEVNEYFHFLQFYDQQFTSLELPIGDEENTLLKEIIADNKINIEQSVLNKNLKENLNSILEELTPREREIIKLRYGIEDGRERTLQEIGDFFNLTRERIRQIETKALRRLRHPKRSQKIKDYLQIT